MAFHPDVLTPAQQHMLRRLAQFTTARRFALAGGTATAIHLGHRRSVDLDWFTDAEIGDPLTLAADLSRAGVKIEVEDVAAGTLHGSAEGVRLSFLEYRYPPLLAPVEMPEYGCRVSAPDDLAAMKLSAVAGRGARKDFVDVYALGRMFTLDRMLDLYRRKFGVQDLGHTLMSLTFFDDAEEDEMPEMLWQVDWEEVKRTIESWVVAFVREA